jgi:hypothetical protein
VPANVYGYAALVGYTLSAGKLDALAALDDIDAHRAGEAGGDRGVLADTCCIQKADLSSGNVIGHLRASQSKQFDLACLFARRDSHSCCASGRRRRKGIVPSPGPARCRAEVC